MNHPLLAKIDKLRDTLVNELDINDKMRDNHVKLEEQMKIEVAENVTLRAENRKLKEKLATQEEAIKVLTEGVGAGYRHKLIESINSNREKAILIKQLQKKLEKLKLPPSLSKPSTAAKRKKTTEYGDNATKIQRVATASHQLLITMKHTIWSSPRDGITIVNDYVAILNVRDGWRAGQCLMMNMKTQNISPITPPDSFITSVAILNDTFVTASHNGTIIKWNKQCEIIKMTRPTQTSTKIKVVNNELVALALRSPLMILDQDLEVIKQFKGTPNLGAPQCLDANDNYIAFGDYEGQVQFYDWHGPSEPTIYQHGERITAISIAGDLLASSSSDKSVAVWSMSQKKLLVVMKHDDAVWCVVIHKDMVITASHDKTVRVWEAQTGKLLHTLMHSAWCNNLDISPDQSLLAVAQGIDGAVSVWSLEDFKHMAEIKLQHNGNASDVRFMDSRTLIAGNLTGEINLITLN